MHDGNKMYDKKKNMRIKVISMGNAGVGKSCIIKRYCEKRFVHKYLATVGIDYGVTKISVKDRDVKVNIFDMAGHPLFYEVRNEFYKDTQGAILVYDATDKNSFDSLDMWLNELRSEIGNKTEIDSVFTVLCANKSDGKAVVDISDAQLWADARGIRVFQTSAQTGQGVQEMFLHLFEGVVGTVEAGGVRQTVGTQLGYTKEQADAIQRLKNAKTHHERMGLPHNASRDDVNKAYRKLAVLLHPDKNVAPGSEEAFKLLVAARTSLLREIT